MKKLDGGKRVNKCVSQIEEYRRESYPPRSTGPEIKIDIRSNKAGYLAGRKGIHDDAQDRGFVLLKLNNAFSSINMKAILAALCTKGISQDFVRILLSYLKIPGSQEHTLFLTSLKARFSNLYSVCWPKMGYFTEEVEIIAFADYLALLITAKRKYTPDMVKFLETVAKLTSREYLQLVPRKTEAFFFLLTTYNAERGQKELIL